MGIELSENARIILEARYLGRDVEGTLTETPQDMFSRVAHAVAAAERVFDWNEKAGEYEEKFYHLMASLEFLPNSPTLMNAGRELGQLSACFVLPIEDSLESIFETLKETAIIHKSGGGTGFSFSRLRPASDIVATTSGIASGPVSFMKIFNAATDIIKQGGTRRGANMGVLRADHPDIEEFITIKRNPDELQSFNLSVGVGDDFMAAARQDAPFPLVNPRTGRVVREVRAKDLFDLMAACAWESGEPGLLFLDSINRDNPTPCLGAIECTNPCGEQPLLPYESCNLGSINLVKMLRRGLSSMEIDWDKLGRTVELAVRFLDDVIEVNHFPIPDIERMTRGNRKVGLGVMGFAHLLILMGIPYGSRESIAVAEELMSFITARAHAASRDLARKRGEFPNFEKSTLALKGDRPMRNAVVTTIAPTGTLSIIADCSNGIEPLYALCTTRTVAGGIELSEVDPVFRLAAGERGLLGDRHEEGLQADVNVLPEDLRRLFVTALDVPPVQHVKVQAAFQRHTDNAVSKTVNFPSNLSPDVMKETLLLAHELGCKGITIYRDKSRAGQVVRCGQGKVC
ncbi:MAG TPA: adenosylcobalamin-dependent ribonucleoside-diphosphate reductase [Deltaproteobacteria bacterium]|nr:adenosylcobalamin-dependent ribonucleoside-diphosphate reductase [Deltaproteobacteria bacterium]